MSVFFFLRERALKRRQEARE